MKQIYKYWLWVFCAALWTALCFILPDFLDNPINDFPTFLKIGVYISALAGASFGLLYLLGLNKYAACIFLPIFGVVGAIVSYFRIAFHATITPMVIDATLHTNGGTIAGVISWQLIIWISFNLIIAILLVLWRYQHIQLSSPWAHALFAVIFVIGYYNAYDRLRVSINQRYPYNIIHSFIEYTKQQQQLSSDRRILAYEVRSIPDSIDVIFVLGEAVRADHIQLNGYERKTTPRLASRTNIVSMPNVYSEQTYTTTSVPIILSPADSIHPERSGTYTSFIKVMKENGFFSAWLSNQDNGRTYVSFIHEADTIIFPNASKSVFVFDPWYDEQLLPPLDELMAYAYSRNLYVLHTIGSHWYYNLHVPAKQQIFTPMTANRIITNNTQEQIINSYDNTVFYLDMLIDSLIQRLEFRYAILIYLSDHGEALGENGQYLHAGDLEAVHNPACIIWYSDKYAKLFPNKIEALVANKDKRYRTDFLFYSILSAAGIEAEGDSPEMNIFR